MDASFFVTQFIVFRSPDLVKIEVFDLEPVLNSDKTIVMEKGPSKRLVMQEDTARHLYEALGRHLAESKKEAATESAPQKNALSFYEEITKINGEARSGVEKKNIQDIASIFGSLSELSSEALKTIASKVLENFPAQADPNILKGLSASVPLVANICDTVLPQFGLQKKSKAADLLVAMTGYVAGCCVEGEKNLTHVRALLESL